MCTRKPTENVKAGGNKDWMRYANLPGSGCNVVIRGGTVVVVSSEENKALMKQYYWLVY